MNARYELVAVDEFGNGKIIKSKKGTKLTLQELDLFTTLFNSPAELNTYLLEKKHYKDFKPVRFAALYKVNNTSRYIDCCYKDETAIISLAHSSKDDNKVSEYNSIFMDITNNFFKSLTDYRMKGFLEFAISNKYINEYIYEKMREYENALLNNERLTKLSFLRKKIVKELSKEYLQVRKLYSGLKKYQIIMQKEQAIVTQGFSIDGYSDDPYVQYLIERVKNGDYKAYEELMGMDNIECLVLKR